MNMLQQNDIWRNPGKKIGVHFVGGMIFVTTFFGLLRCDIGGSKMVAGDDVFFKKMRSYLEPHNPQNHRVDKDSILKILIGAIGSKLPLFPI